MPEFQLPYNQFSEHDERILTDLVNKIDGGVFCEVGCWTGHSTSIIAKRAKEIGSKVIVIDNFLGNDGTPLVEFFRDNNIRDIFINNMKELDLYHNIILFCMDSSEAWKYVNNDVSFLFIDAGHTYIQVKNDILYYSPKLLSDSIICGHDYESNTYDERYINEDYVDGKHHGVIKAVNEIFGKVNFDGRMWWKRI